jgi:class 3 adenylate cyclase
MADGQILINQPVYSAVAGIVDVEDLGEIDIRGFQGLFHVYNVLGLKKGGEQEPG